MTHDAVKYTQSLRPRFAELTPDKSGRWEAAWQLTDTTLTDVVSLTLPPSNVIPIIFVPGIMGTNLSDLYNQPVWLLNVFSGVPVGLAAGWAKKPAGERQAILHPERTRVFNGGALPPNNRSLGIDQIQYRQRGWGEVSEASYHKFLLWLENKMNGQRNPAAWEDFSHASLKEVRTMGEKIGSRLPSGLMMKTNGLPESSDNGGAVDQISSDELLKRSKSTFPVYAFGYNWLASNMDAAKSLASRVQKVIAENNVGSRRCRQVIIVTHSMGGLVARACAQMSGMSQKIIGIVHGVMPATGAAVAYRRCKVGMRDEDYAAGLVIGSDGREVTAVFAQAPGALQLLPSESYGTNWLQVHDPKGKALLSLPDVDPYEEIYLKKDQWWGLVDEDWLKPIEGKPISWDYYVRNIKIARDFHRKIDGKYHHNTYVFFGGGEEKQSFSKIVWNLKKGSMSERESDFSVNKIKMLNRNEGVRTDGSNNVYFGGRTVVRTTTRGDALTMLKTEESQWEARCSLQDGSGDGTVPVRSGRAPRETAPTAILEQFELPGIQHEPAYRDYPIAQMVTYYAITKLAAKADLS
ncbi:alpha/beta hydrolase [Massilia arenae]|uniref:Alpha/beta hydrolase n=2 Tax=Massilia arenae TaxID=2603288 RepID=A0A5C7FQN3_9BURK|nr:alpha/beta hydrolase [Massilia arenae]